MFKFLKGLISEGESASLGRVGFWLVFIPAIWIWLFKTQDIWVYHFYTLVVFLMYNFSKKIPLFIALIKAWKGTDSTEKSDES